MYGVRDCSNFILLHVLSSFSSTTYYILFIYSFIAALGLHCCVWAFSSCWEQGLLFVAVHRLLLVAASLVAEHRL